MYTNILVPVDLQETAMTTRAVEVATEISAHFDSSITLMTVIPDFGLPVVANFFPDDAMQKARNEVVAELDRFVVAHFSDPSRVRTRVFDGTPHKVIVDYAEGHEIDLIVIPARVKDLSKVFLGSSSTHVAERAPCSVLIVRA